jgi:hypothetical protein
MRHRTWWVAIMAVIAMASGVGGQAPPGDGGAQRNPPAAPAKEHRDVTPRSGVPASHAPAGVAWGPGRELQAGLVLEGRYGSPQQHTGLYVFGVYLRNRSRQALSVDCPSFAGLSVPWDETDYSTLVQSPLIYCSPHVRDGRGKPVDVKFRPGTDRIQFAVGPGQVVYVAHWMLRTMDRRAKGSNTASYTQVAFVEPGKYRVYCDVSASWGTKGGRPTTLRTGDVAFDVTATDVAE